jgi:long-subunit fatty acid transport protein
LNGTNSAGKTVDFGYYTVEPKAEYAITQKLSALASYRFRDSFSDSQAYLTRTAKVGAGYAVTKNDLVEVKYFEKRGDSSTNGVEVGYTRGF